MHRRPWGAQLLALCLRERTWELQPAAEPEPKLHLLSPVRGGRLPAVRVLQRRSLHQHNRYRCCPWGGWELETRRVLLRRSFYRRIGVLRMHAGVLQKGRLQAAAQRPVLGVPRGALEPVLEARFLYQGRDMPVLGQLEWRRLQLEEVRHGLREQVGL